MSADRSLSDLGVKSFYVAYVSMKRIEDFLKESEVPDWASSLTDKVVNKDSNANSQIGFSGAVFEWEEACDDNLAASRFQLGPLSFVFPVGKLTIVSGATGSGKSALLIALLGGQAPHQTIFLSLR